VCHSADQVASALLRLSAHVLSDARRAPCTRLQRACSEGPGLAPGERLAGRSAGDRLVRPRQVRNEVLGRLMRFLEPYSTRANLIVRLNREWDRAVEQFAAAEAELRAAFDAGAAPTPWLDPPALRRWSGVGRYAAARHACDDSASLLRALPWQCVAPLLVAGLRVLSLGCRPRIRAPAKWRRNGHCFFFFSQNVLGVQYVKLQSHSDVPLQTFYQTPADKCMTWRQPSQPPPACGGATS